MSEYIERKALDKALTAAAAHDKDKNRRTWAKAICVLHDLTAADVAPVVHGRWEAKGYVCGESEFECSVCHKTEWRTSISRFRWCPFCGARMDGDSDAKEN